MLAQPVRLPEQNGVFREGEWIFQRKLDGLRCVAIREGARVELWSRNRLSFLARFPEVATAVSRLPVDVVLDGELVYFDGQKSNFSKLQGPHSAGHAVYCAFDVLRLLGQDTTALAYRDRADLLSKLVEASAGSIEMPETVVGAPEDLLRQACSLGWEGLVAKRASSLYRSGRSPDWRKLKCSSRQELLIGGWTEPTGSRSRFGALLVGYYDESGLRYAGKVGTGFDQATLISLGERLRELAQNSSPFVDPPRERALHWVSPVLVAEISFSEWTRDRRLRHPSFLGLRPDKSPSEVRLEHP